MPEFPDIEVYREALATKVLDHDLLRIQIFNPFVVRTAIPPIGQAQDRRVLSVRRMGKRIVFGLTGQYWLVIHLMIAGRLQWFDEPLVAGSRAGSRPPAKRPRPPTGKQTLARLDFSTGSLYMTEAGTKRRASIHLVSGEEALHALDPGGLEVMQAGFDEFCARVRAENHTLKRTMTDPKILSGIGNAYSDEILHRAGLSPMIQTARADDETLRRLYEAIRQVLAQWTERLRQQSAANGGFPPKVTAFHDEMAVHGKFGQPCPVCNAKVQRIRYASNETNYCAQCQTGGVVLRDRALSRLLKASWPAKLEEQS